MKISPITNYSFNKINQYKNTHLSFCSTSEAIKPQKENPLLKAQIKAQAKSLLKASEKNEKLAHEILKESRLVRVSSNIILSDSKRVQDIAQKIKKQGILSAITPNNGKIGAYIGDEKTKDLYIFNSITKELETCYINAKSKNGTLSADRCFSFKDDKLDTYDEFYTKIQNDDYQYIKSLYRYIFEDDNLSEYSKDTEIWQGLRMKMGEVFAYDDKNLSCYCKDITYELESGYDYAKTQITFDSKGQMEEYIIGEMQEPTKDTSSKKRFYYQNGFLKLVQTNLETIRGYSKQSNKTFIFAPNQSGCCHLNEVEKETGTTYSKSISFKL